VGKGGRAVSLVAAADLVAFNRLVKRYHVEVKEIPVPTDEEVQERKADRIVEALAEAGRRLPLDDFLDLGPAARRIAAHEMRDRIVAFLLKGHLAAVPAPVEEEEAPAASAPGRAVGAGPRRGRRRGRGRY
jgi:hypothetical protein